MSDVRLVWATPNIEHNLAYIARVSNPQNQNHPETAAKLISYLMRNKHWSPFEMVNICMEITTTRDIARQILRHRSFSFQEFSQRYAQVDSFAMSEARLQDTKNRQNSLETEDIVLKGWWNEAQNLVQSVANDFYKAALEKGIAKEVARKVLPEGLAVSKMYMNGTLRSWLHYIDVRTDPSTQKEHREVAEKCREVVLSLLPNHLG